MKKPNVMKIFNTVKKAVEKKKSRDSYCFWYCRNDYNYCTGSKSYT